MEGGRMATEQEAAEVMETLKDLNLSKDEVKRLTTAMKDPQFKTMFMDYAKEISEPANKEALENHIHQCEERNKGGGRKEFSMEGKDLLIPYPDFCIKTRNVKTTQKVFINLCHCEKVANPVAIDDPFRHGTQWEIPYTLGPPSKDKDKGCHKFFALENFPYDDTFDQQLWLAPRARLNLTYHDDGYADHYMVLRKSGIVGRSTAGKECEVNDFIVGTEAHEHARDNKRFKHFLILTALEAVEKQRHLELDRKFSLPLLKYKGRNGSKETRMFTVPKKAAKDGTQMGKEITPRSRSRSPFKFDRDSNKHVKFEDVDKEKAAGGRGVAQGEVTTLTSPTAAEKPPVAAPNDVVVDGMQPEDACKIVYPEGWDTEVEPKYEMVYRSTVDYGDFWEDSNLSPDDPLPKEILVRVTLPNVVNAPDILVDLEESRVMLRVPGKYRLKVQLRYTVDESRGRAQWDKQKHQLNIILPVDIAPKAVNQEAPLLGY